MGGHRRARREASRIMARDRTAIVHFDPRADRRMATAGRGIINGVTGKGERVASPRAETTRPAGVRPANRILQFFLIIFMGIGSISLWLAVPVFWVWLASQMQKS